MTTSESHVDGDFEAAMTLTNNNAVAAAVIAHAKVLARFEECLDHNICMGIRHGFFGGHADNDVSFGEPDPTGKVRSI